MQYNLLYLKTIIKLLQNNKSLYDYFIIYNGSIIKWLTKSKQQNHGDGVKHDRVLTASGYIFIRLSHWC